MRRRGFLRRVAAGGGAAGLVAVAGCTDPDETVGWLAARPATPERLASLVAVGPFERDLRGPLTGGTARTDLNGTTLARYLDAAPFRAPEGGNLTLPPEAFDDPVYYGGRVYDLTERQVGERHYVDYEFTVRYGDGPAAGRVVGFENLTAADRRALEDLFPIPEYRREELREAGVTPGHPGGDEPGVYDAEASARYDGAERNRSRVVARSGIHRYAEGIQYNGTRFTLYVERTGEERIPVRRYAVADGTSVASFARRLKRRYRRRLDGLSEAQRSVLDEAVGGRVRVTPSTDAATALLERLRRADQLPVRPGARPVGTPTGTSSHWLVRYGGADYVLGYDERRDEYGGLG